jgi:uncharacterized membrane protein YoaK (UPF0700 family)
MREQQMNRYFVEFGGAMLAYVVLLPLSIFAYRAVDQDALRALIAVVPIIPTVFGLVAILRAVRRMDELERRVQFEAVAFAFAATALLTFTYGLLENVDFPRISLTWVLSLMILLWALGQALARRRYAGPTP